MDERQGVEDFAGLMTATLVQRPDQPVLVRAMPPRWVDDDDGDAQLTKQQVALPYQTHDDDLGYDLTISQHTTCRTLHWTDVPHGIACKLPAGYGARIVGRSSTLRKRGLLVQEGIIDTGYTGELFSCVWNPMPYDVELQAGDRIAQLILVARVGAAFKWVEALPETSRSANGFGSTGR